MADLPSVTFNVEEDDDDRVCANANTQGEPNKDVSDGHSIFNGNFPSDIHDKYTPMEEVLGTGSFGIVSKCKNKETGEICALKTIDKTKLTDATQLRREVDILLDVDHPHIIKLHDVYEDDTTIFLVSELCLGGELYDRVIEKARSKEGHFSEFTAARIIKNILSAIRYCHDEKKIVHRDLKPANFLLTDKTDNAQVKVIDFGLSRYSANRMESQVGTIYYVAPEVLLGEYTEKADIWSIGVVTYVLLCGFPPFNAGSEGLTYTLVEKGVATFPSPAWDRISPEAVRFVKRLLEKDPDARPSAADALGDRWLQRQQVRPFRTKWHGTFLNFKSPEAKAVDPSRKIEYSDQEKQSAFARLFSRKREDKKVGYTGSFKSFLTSERSKIDESSGRVNTV
eukprot:jgi/Psemu1/189340/e_gw1.87.66.1